MKRIYLTSCSKGKLDHAAPAGEIYSPSAIFNLRMQLINKLKDPEDRILIISAKHGALDLEDVIEPYDVTVMGMSPAALLKWTTDVVLKSLVDKGIDLQWTEFISFCPASSYARYFSNVLPHVLQLAPSLPQGQLRQWFIQEIAKLS